MGLHDDDASPTAESPGYIVDSDSMEEDKVDGLSRVLFAPPLLTPKKVYKDPDDGHQRFLLELEFVQSATAKQITSELIESLQFGIDAIQAAEVRAMT
ncbi:hypothetical protein Tco_1239209, partial [Tanacetum coccineum]